jgi:hypothetical protein
VLGVLLRRGRLGIAALACVTLAGCTESRTPSADSGSTTAHTVEGSRSTPTAKVLYALEPTRQCLESRGAITSEVHPADERFQALRDLAQRNSMQATVGDETVGMAFAASDSDSQLLMDLLTVPGDPYRIITNKNVVLVYRARAEAAFRASLDCLRS